MDDSDLPRIYYAANNLWLFLLCFKKKSNLWCIWSGFTCAENNGNFLIGKITKEVVEINSPKGIKSDDWGSYKYGEWKHIMHRGDPLKSNDTPTNYDPCKYTKNIDVNVRQLPGFYLAPNLNKLYCKIRRSTVATDIESEEIILEDIIEILNLMVIPLNSILTFQIMIISRGKLLEEIIIMHQN